MINPDLGLPFATWKAREGRILISQRDPPLQTNTIVYNERIGIQHGVDHLLAALCRLFPRNRTCAVGEVWKVFVLDGEVARTSGGQIV